MMDDYVDRFNILTVNDTAREIQTSIILQTIIVSLVIRHVPVWVTHFQ